VCAVCFALPQLILWKSDECTRRVNDIRPSLPVLFFPKNFSFSVFLGVASRASIRQASLFSFNKQGIDRWAR
jgi:hypothetical protein